MAWKPITRLEYLHAKLIADHGLLVGLNLYSSRVIAIPDEAYWNETKTWPEFEAEEESREATDQ